jgi:hypothetical protein
MGMARWGVVCLLVMFGCGDGSSSSGGGATDMDASMGHADSSPGSRDAGDPDAPPGDPDAGPGDPDASSPRDAMPPDASDGADGSPDAMPGGECPPLDGEGDGVTPAFIETIESSVPDPQSAASAILLTVDDADDCSFVVGGYSRAGAVTLGRGEPNETAMPADVWFVARYEAAGQLAWAVDLGAHPPTDDRMRVRVMAGGGVAVVKQDGLFGNTLQHLSADGVVLDDPMPLPFGVARPLDDGGAYLGSGGLQRITADGDVVWARSITTPPESIDELPDGRLVLAGGFNFGGVVLNAGEPDEQVIDTSRDGCYVALYGSDGSLQWVRAIELSGVERPLCAAAAGDGWVGAWIRYYIDDWTTFRIATGTGPPIETDEVNAVVVRYEDTGELTWAHTLFESLEESSVGFEYQALSVDPQRGTLTVGGLADIGGGFTQIFPDTASSGGGFGGEPNQGWFGRFGADGSIVGLVPLSSPQPGESSVNATATRIDGSAIVVGYFSGTLVLGPLEATPAGGWEAGFIAEVH